MSEITLNPDQLKEILKSAIIELLRENRGEVLDLLSEIIEDIARDFVGLIKNYFYLSAVY